MNSMPTGTGGGELLVLGRSGTALLTTYRRDGTPVATPVSLALHAGRAYFVTAADSGKARRLARSGRVTLAPCTVGGVPTGRSVTGRARLVEGAQRGRPRQLLRPGGPLFWSYLLYRVRGHRMDLYEVVLTGPGPGVVG
jgi:PPOX class probable F420-dependent enzyme